MKKIVYAIGLLTIIGSSLALIWGFNDTDNTDDNLSVGLEELVEYNSLSDLVDIESFVPSDYLEDGEMDDDIRIIYTEPDGKSTFETSRFTQFDRNASDKTLKKIKEIHIPELIKVQDALGQKLVIRSGARSKAHELKKGRSGKSQHVYGNGLGAVDVSLKSYSKDNLDILEQTIIKKTNYNRIARYSSFIHLDFAKNRYDGRGYYRNTEYGWVYIGKIK